MAGLWEELWQGLSNGAQSYGDQAKWAVGGYGDAPRPAPYAGGPDYPAKDDANAYVRQNWPSDGRRLLHTVRPDTLYTPVGGEIPPGGRDATIGEMARGAPTMASITPWVAEFLAKFEKLNGRR